MDATYRVPPPRQSALCAANRLSPDRDMSCHDRDAGCRVVSRAQHFPIRSLFAPISCTYFPFRCQLMAINAIWINNKLLMD